MRVGGLFAGYAGLELGLRDVWPDAELAWYAEVDKGALKVLTHRFPGVPNLGDVTRVDWASVEPVDVLTGGFPCTDVSTAGKRAGLIHGTRSGLWHEFARAIEALRPGLVIIENVRGLLSARGDTSEEYDAAVRRVALATGLREWQDQRYYRALREGRHADAQRIRARTAHRLMVAHRRAVADRGRAERRIPRAIATVLGTLASLGYDAQWHGLRAADIGAPHGRFRVFLTARPAGDTDRSHRDRWRPTGLQGQARPTAGPLPPSPRGSDAKGGSGRHGDGGVDLRTAVSLLPTPRATDGTHGSPHQRGSKGDLMLPSAVHGLSLLPTPTSTPYGHQRSASSGAAIRPGLDTLARFLPTPRTANWAQYAPAIHRWETTLSRDAPPPTEPAPKGGQRLSARFVEWMMGLPDGWVTDTPGITRAEALRCLGNGCVPQQVAAALRVMLATEAAA